MQLEPLTLPPAPASGPARDVASASEAWPELEGLTRLAARALQSPAAVLVLAGDGGNTLRVACAHGVDPAAANGGTLFYREALREPAAFLVPDARRHARVSESPLVRREPHFRACAAVALPGLQGEPHPGVLCVFDGQPRIFTPADAAALHDLADLILRELERHDAGLRHETELEARVRERTAELADAESRYRSIFENAVEGIYQSLPNGGFLSVNPALARLLGYDSPEAMLRVLPDPGRLYVQPGRRAEFEARIIAEGELAGWESEAYRADGTHLWIAEYARAIRDAQGRVMRYEGTFEDITARKTAEEALQRAREELEDRVRERTAELAMLNGTLRQHILERESAEAASRRSESKFRALIENAQDLISVLTPDGISLYQSPSVEHLMGFPAGDLIGRNIFEDFVHPDDRAAVARAAASIVEDGEHYVCIEVRCRHRDGSWRLLESIGSSTPPESPVVGLVVNSRDITERRRAELEHEARNREQTAVAELGRYALDGRSLPEILDKTAELVARALEVPFCTITELLPGDAKLRVCAGVGWREGVVRDMEVDNWRRMLPAAEPPAPVGPLIVADLEVSLGRPYLLPAADGMDRPRSAISVVVHCDGQRFGTLCALSPALGRFGAQDAVFLQTVADLLSAVTESERHKAASREVQARYERIAANTPGLVYQSIRHADGTATVPFVSEGCRQLYGREPAQLCAQPHLMNDAIHPDDRPAIDALLAASNAALTPLAWEGRLVHPSGEVRWVAARSRPERMPNGDIYRDGVVFDVTELKQAQEEAEKANLAKSEFLSRISHELRTPLNAILGFGQLLDLEPLNPRQRSSVEQILKGGRHLLDLINEVLDITRIESGGMDLSLGPVDVTAVLAEALNFVRPLAEQHRVRFVRPDSSVVRAVVADRGRLHQVLLNLLSNAVKYNRPDGEVRVSCLPLREGTVRLSITDTGPGMTPAEVRQLFTPFQRLGAALRGIAGTGIGLTISRSLVGAMGGEIGVESTPGVGSTFYVDLPAAPAGSLIPFVAAPEDLLPATPPAGAAAAERTILLIDDQNTNVSLIERVLETRTNLRLFTAPDGRGGLALARKQPPDLILLDLHLPDMGGDEVMRRLRLETRTRDVPVVVLSADATPAQITRLRQLGVREYLTKPFRIRELLAAIDAALAAPAANPAAR